MWLNATLLSNKLALKKSIYYLCVDLLWKLLQKILQNQLIKASVSHSEHYVLDNERFHLEKRSLDSI